MSSSYSFAHHKSVYQLFFFFHFISIAFLLSSLYLLPHQHSFFLRLLSLFSFLSFFFSSFSFSSLSFPLPSYNPTFFLPFGAPSPPPPPRPHLTSSSPPSFLPNLLLQSLPLQLPAYPSAFILPWTLNFFCFSPSHHPLLSFQTTSTRL